MKGKKKPDVIREGPSVVEGKEPLGSVRKKTAKEVEVFLSYEEPRTSMDIDYPAIQGNLLVGLAENNLRSRNRFFSGPLRFVKDEQQPPEVEEVQLSMFYLDKITERNNKFNLEIQNFENQLNDLSVWAKKFCNSHTPLKGVQ